MYTQFILIKYATMDMDMSASLIFYTSNRFVRAFDFENEEITQTASELFLKHNGTMDDFHSKSSHLKF